MAVGAQITAIICITVLVALKMLLDSVDKDKKKGGTYFEGKSGK